MDAHVKIHSFPRRAWHWQNPPVATSDVRVFQSFQYPTGSKIMGKGDRKTAKGKRFNSSYGVSRPAVTKAAGTAAAPVAKKTAASKAASKATAKKVVAKKTVAKE